jgi:16S rRNA (cytidine1402-2'-O)-methyltransferase
MEGASDAELKAAAFWADMSVSEHVEYYLETGLSKNDSIKAVARDRGVAKSEIYNQVMIK